VRRLVAAAMRAPGNLGVTTLISPPGRAGLHHVVFRFADQASMKAWEDSEIRRTLSQEADAFSRVSRQEATGLETWFSIPNSPELGAPPLWKMTAVTFIAVYLLSIIIVPLGERFLGSWPFPVLNILTCILLVTLMSYAVMPFFSRVVFRRWLYR
jgi:hypothetical protein